MAERVGFSVWADWAGLESPQRVGIVELATQRGYRSAGFSFDEDWLARQDSRILDPRLQPFRGPQYAPGRVSAWRTEARRLGIPRSEIERMEPAFSG